MKRSTSAPFLPAFLAGVILASATGYYAGRRTGLKNSFLKDKRLANEPEVIGKVESRWVTTGKQNPELQESTGSVPVSGRTTDDREQPVFSLPFALDAARPIRISWPLDIGPDVESDHKDDRVCLRARTGVNEIQQQGAGWALYGFRIREKGKYRAFCRVRWTTDGVSVVACNNSWFLRYDDRAAYMLGTEKDEKTDWHWARGREVELGSGIHWVRVELREDGPVMDRIVIARGGSKPDESWDTMRPVTFGGLAGKRPPFQPQNPIGEVEFFTLPSGSLVIGKGHENALLVSGSWEGGSEGGFDGNIRVFCKTAPGLKVEGEARALCNASQPHMVRTLKLKFPADTDRRSHLVNVEVQDQTGRSVFCQSIPFLKGYEWAFLGPFKDFAKLPKAVYRMTGSIRRLALRCDRNPGQLARLGSPKALGLAKLALAPGHESLEWKIVPDGSCYDWTGVVDFNRVYGHVEGAFAYAVTWVSAEVGLNHRSFNFQPDDSGWLWMNGYFLAELPADLPREANRLWTSAKLKRGPNPVVIKLAQNQRYWGFRLDVIDWHWQGRRGDVIRGIESKDWPSESKKKGKK